MSKTSAAVKNRYNSKAYDRISVVCKKGDKEKYQKHAEKNGKSLNGLINELLEREISGGK